MSQHTGSHKNSLNLLGEKYLSHIGQCTELRLLECRYYTIQAANNKGADQTVQMHRLICAFVVRIGQKQVFS